LRLVRRRWRSGGTAPVYWNDSWAVSSTTSVSATYSAVGMDCEYRKLVSSTKKLRKTTTNRSRLACISSSLKASSSTSMATPASRPSRVRKVR
jgi:hypothetical protein